MKYEAIITNPDSILLRANKRTTGLRTLVADRHHLPAECSDKEWALILEIHDRLFANKFYTNKNTNGVLCRYLFRLVIWSSIYRRSLFTLTREDVLEFFRFIQDPSDTPELKAAYSKTSPRSSMATGASSLNKVFAMLAVDHDIQNPFKDLTLKEILHHSMDLLDPSDDFVGYRTGFTAFCAFLNEAQPIGRQKFLMARFRVLFDLIYEVHIPLDAALALKYSDIRSDEDGALYFEAPPRKFYREDKLYLPSTTIQSLKAHRLMFARKDTFDGDEYIFESERMPRAVGLENMVKRPVSGPHMRDIFDQLKASCMQAHLAVNDDNVLAMNISQLQFRHILRFGLLDHAQIWARSRGEGQQVFRPKCHTSFLGTGIAIVPAKVQRLRSIQ